MVYTKFEYERETEENQYEFWKWLRESGYLEWNNNNVSTKEVYDDMTDVQKSLTFTTSSL